MVRHLLHARDRVIALEKEMDSLIRLCSSFCESINKGMTCSYVLFSFLENGIV